MKGDISNDIGTIIEPLHIFNGGELAHGPPLLKCKQTVSRADIGDGCTVATPSLVGEFFVKGR